MGWRDGGARSRSRVRLSDDRRGGFAAAVAAVTDAGAGSIDVRIAYHGAIYISITRVQFHIKSLKTYFCVPAAM